MYKNGKIKNIIEIKCLTIFKDFTEDKLLNDSKKIKTKRIINFLYYDTNKERISIDTSDEKYY